MKRVLAGFVATVCLIPAWLLVRGGDHADEAAATAAWVTATVGLMVGIPAFAVFRRRRWWQLWQYLCGGGIAGTLCAPLAASTLPAWFIAAFFVIGGMAHATLFWVVAIWHNRELPRPRQFRLPCGSTYPFAPEWLSTPGRERPSLSWRRWLDPRPTRRT